VARRARDEYGVEVECGEVLELEADAFRRARAATWLGLFCGVAVGWRVVIVFATAMVMMVIAVA
jgi:hypothetical protein